MTLTNDKHTQIPTMLMKVPEITIGFWIAKLASTAFGEAFSDFVFFNDYLGQHLAILLGLAFLLACMAIQFTRRRYVPVAYWLAATSVSIFGTMSADFLNVDLGLPLWASTLMLLALQSAVFVIWYRTQKTLNVHSINTHLRELFYWLTVLFTFALGTAAGDFVSTTLGLGTFAASFVFLAVILIPAIGFRFFRMQEVAAFWIAYTFTRPLGASVADWLGVPAPYGDGLGLGTSTTSAGFGALLAIVVATLAIRHRRTGSLEAAELRTAPAS